MGTNLLIGAFALLFGPAALVGRFVAPGSAVFSKLSPMKERCSGRLGRSLHVVASFVLPALLAACAPAEAATAPPSALTQVQVYDTATSTWHRAAFASVRAGDELHHAGHLLEATPEGLVDRGAVALGTLTEASHSWSVRTPFAAPDLGDWVLVLDPADGPHHAPLSAALEEGERFVHGGHVFESAWQGGAPVVRWSGDVLARATGGMVRTADGVFDLVIEGEAGRQTLEVTPEHPFWVTDTGWLWVEDLAVGDALRTLDGSVARVVGKAWRPGDVEVFNIAVEGAHTYFVGGWTPVLAHNCKLTGGASSGADAAGSGRTFVTDPDGNTLIVPEGGRVTGRADSSFVQTRRADGSISQRKDQAHREPAPGEAPSSQQGTAAHGHGLDADGNSLDVQGNIVDRTSPEAHWDAR